METENTIDSGDFGWAESDGQENKTARTSKCLGWDSNGLGTLHVNWVLYYKRKKES